VFCWTGWVFVEGAVENFLAAGGFVGAGVAE
jgi:hypothetical protein